MRRCSASMASRIFSILTPREPFRSKRSPRVTNFARNRAASSESSKNCACSAGCPASTAARTNSARVTSHAENPIDFPELRCGAATLAVQVGRGIAELEHLAGRENPAAMSRRGRKKFRHRIQRGRARIVGVVDHRKSVLETSHFAALVRRDEQIRKHLFRVGRADSPNAGRRERGQSIHHVVPADQRQFEPRTPPGRHEIESRAFDAAFFDFFGAKVGALWSPKEITRPRATSAKRATRSSSAFSTAVGLGHAKIFDQLALGQRDLVDRREKFQMLQARRA